MYGSLSPSRNKTTKPPAYIYIHSFFPFSYASFKHKVKPVGISVRPVQQPGNSTVIAVRKHLLFIVGEAGNNCFGDIETFPVIRFFFRHHNNGFLKMHGQYCKAAELAGPFSKKSARSPANPFIIANEFRSGNIRLRVPNMGSLSTTSSL